MKFVCYDKASVLVALEKLDFDEDNVILLGTTRYQIPKTDADDALKREKARRRAELLRKFKKTPAKVLKVAL